MSFRTTLIVLNILALAVIAGVILWRVFSLKREQEPAPANLTKFLEDDDLEGRRLERVLGWSLLFVLVVAISLPVYFLVEPNRQVVAKDAFLARSEARGAVLFANSQSPAYDSTKSLLCANCHGTKAEGGAAPFTIQAEADLCLVAQNKGNPDVPACLPRPVSWQAPALDTVLLRFNRGQVKHILNYGRPGTPMPAWGIISGKGVLNEKSIDDLVNYLASLQIPSAKAKSISTQAVGEYRTGGKQLVKQQREALTAAQADLAKAQADRTATPKVKAQAEAAVVAAQAQYDAAVAYDAEVRTLSDGAILFRLNCARCHTKGWSYYDPTDLTVPAPSPQGSGAYGPNLTGGSTKIQFPGKAGAQGQFDWVAVGVPENQQYGVRGISSGRMPHFAGQLDDAEIKAIVKYERSL
ncbi:MAG: c-type cytochrome [Acidimicrobiia bacterium]|nr:c-type cytochrome [Acidimicrobiia bacterium]